MSDETFAAQGSAEWLAERAGHATASCFQKIIALGRDGKPLKARSDYLWLLAMERIYGAPKDAVSSRSLEWGTESEPLARDEYQLQTGNIVVETGFLKHPTILWVGSSLDGKVGPNGTIEVKCPKDSVVHLQTWANGMPEEHRPQVQGGLWISGRLWCDFISYDPRAPQEAMLYVERIYRDEAYIKELESKVLTFLAEVTVLEKKLRNKFVERKAA